MIQFDRMVRHVQFLLGLSDGRRVSVGSAYEVQVVQNSTGLEVRYFTRGKKQALVRTTISSELLAERHGPRHSRLLRMAVDAIQGVLGTAPPQLAVAVAGRRDQHSKGKPGYRNFSRLGCAA